MLLSSAYLFQTTGQCADLTGSGNYTNSDCSFNPDWGEIGGSGAMGAATGMLGATAYMGYGAAVGSMFGPPGSALGAASSYAWGGSWGAATGAGGELMDQYLKWKKITRERRQENI